MFHRSLCNGENSLPTASPHLIIDDIFFVNDKSECSDEPVSVFNLAI